MTALDDKLWDILDKIHLGEFFDKHHIPPIVFPIAVIAVVGLIILMLMSSGGGGAPAAKCGDSICQPAENCTICAGDCGSCAKPPPTTKTVKVTVTGGTTCSSITVKLKSQTGTLIGDPKTSSLRSVTFSSVSEKSVYAEVSSSESTKDSVKSSSVNLETKDTIPVTLPDDYCQAAKKTGTIKVTVKDSVAGTSVTANIALFDSGGSFVTSQTMTGSGLFSNLEAGEYYYLTASAVGYTDYIGTDDMLLVEANRDTLSSILMQKTSATPTSTGKLEVCVRGEDGPIEHSGQVTIYDLEDNPVKTGNCADCALYRGLATSAGCMIFDLPAGKKYYAAVTRAPTACTNSEKVGPFSIGVGNKTVTTIRLSCNLVGGVRAVVYGNDSKVFTENCSIYLYYKNGTKIAKLHMANDSEDEDTSADDTSDDEDDEDAEDEDASASSDSAKYTETISLPAGVKVYAYAKSPPAGYTPTKSSTKEIKVNETTTLRIDLYVTPPPSPNLTMSGALISKTILAKGQNYTMSVSTVSLNGVTQTPTTGVSVTCQLGSTSKAATYASSYGWKCNMTAPTTVGTKTPSIKATKTGANQAVQSFTIYVVNETVPNNLEIVPDIWAFKTGSSPVSLYFYINRTNGTGITAGRVTSLEKTTITAYYKAADNTLHLAAQETSATKVSDGYFKYSFYVPFSGNYYYVLGVQSVYGSKVLYQNISGTFIVSTGTSGLLDSCTVEPSLVAPEGTFKVTATLKMNNKPLGNQRVQITLTGRGDETLLPVLMTWNETSGKYEQYSTAFISECIQNVTCTAQDDTSMKRTTQIYVADPYASGVNTTCLSPTTCDTVEEARNCFRRYVEQKSSQFKTDAESCAQKALDYCSGATPSTGKCHNFAVFQIVATASTTKTSNWTAVWLEGPTDGYETVVPSGADPIPVLSGATYSFGSVYLGGGNIPTASGTLIKDCEGGTSCTTSDMYLKINSTTGAVSAQMYCKMSCGNQRGDLTGEGDVNELDAARMKPIIDALATVGAPPYPNSPSCLDANLDGLVTYDDYTCILNTMQGCTTCTKSSTLEICNDQSDNDCDGQTDRDTYNNAKGEFYGDIDDYTLTNLCDCNAQTPCQMLYDIESEVSGTNTEAAAKRCSSIDGSAYTWRDKAGWECNSARNNDILTCSGQSFYCHEVGGIWIWDYQGTPAKTYPLNVLNGTTHYVCDNNARQCVEMSGNGTSQCTAGTYWGKCAYGTCNALKGTCDITNGNGTSQCSSASGCDLPVNMYELYYLNGATDTWHVIVNSGLRTTLLASGYKDALPADKPLRFYTGDKAGSGRVPLIRMWRDTQGGNVIYATSDAEVAAFSPYGFDAGATYTIDGYIFSTTNPPTGTQPLYELYCGMRDDYYYSTSADSVYCGQRSDGVTAYYQLTGRGAIGYVYPAL